MLDSVKHNLQGKATRFIENGTTNLHKKINDIENLVNSSTQQLTNSLKELSSNPVYMDFVSLEYVLDTIESTRSRKPRLLICGFYGARNLGDELMLQSLLKRINNNKFDITIMLAEHPEVDASIYAPYHVVHYPQRNDDILTLARNYDVIVWGGGAVLDDRWYYFNYSHNSLGYILLKTSLAAFKFNKKVFVLGVSTNQTIEDPNFIQDLQAVVSQADYFSLRDTNSLKTLQNSHIDTSKVKIIDDLAISDLPNRIPQKHSKKPCIGLVFIFNDNNLSIISSFVRLVIAYFADKPVTLNFIPFYDHNDLDQKLFQEILSSLKIPQNITTNIEPFSNNIGELIQTFSQCDCIFSMRYHATLIASLCGIKTLSINYGKEHCHYQNKLSYIKEHYDDFEEIPFSSITDKESVFAAIKRAFEQTSHKYNSQQIRTIDKKLSKILEQINKLS